MSVLIKGMEMPQKIEPGLVIEFANGINGERYARLYHYRHGGLTEWLEAVSVPPHGDLVDRDEMFVEFVVEGQKTTRDKVGEKWELNGEEIRRVIQRLPAVIPAEETPKEDEE